MLVRRFCELCRTVPELVFALMFVIAFGLGPMAGVLAVAIHTVGALGKLFAEVVENIDMKPVEGITAGGSSWPVAMRFGALPQTISNFVSYALLRFEINVRSTAVMGFVGAGGIGQDLIEAIRKFYYSDVSAILVLIVITVSVIDTLTSHGPPSPDRPAGEALMPAQFPVDLDAMRGRHPQHFQRFDRRRRMVIARCGSQLSPCWSSPWASSASSTASCSPAWAGWSRSRA